MNYCENNEPIWVAEPELSLECISTILGDRWKLSIIQTLLDGTTSVRVIKNSIRYISQKVLASNLLELEQLGIVSKYARSPFPNEAEYVLTEKGHALLCVVEAMWSWTLRYG